MWAQGEGLAGYAVGPWAKQHIEWQRASEHVLAQACQRRAAAGPAPTVGYWASSHGPALPVQQKSWHLLTAHIGGKRTESLRWHL